MKPIVQVIAGGVYKLTFGKAEKETPGKQHYRMPPCLEQLAVLPEAKNLPFNFDDIVFKTGKRGCIVEIPLHDGEDLYGFGLQLKSLRQTGKKRALRVNSDPVADTGDSHAPVPLYFSTAGYGVMFDTLRYMNIYTGGNAGKDSIGREINSDGKIALTEDELYQSKQMANPVIAEIPAAQGVDCYIFGGPTLLDAVRRYNLFSGGGCMVPAWGLGIWYRVCGAFNEEELVELAGLLRRSHIPCDVLGLEPGWQSAAYSCSLDWSQQRFKNHRETVKELQKEHFKINLWEHIFINPKSELFDKLKPYSGDYAVWNGLVPDLTVKKAGKIFADYHREKFVSENIISFKLDECDNSDYIASPWSFPECAEFPSGKDGETMHSALGMSYMNAIHHAVNSPGGALSYHSVRNAHLFASPYPFVLYSDLYDHQDFIRGMTTAGFSGLLWCPELRHAVSSLDYLRRLQAMILSPQMLLNIWSMPHPPWQQLDRSKNIDGELYPVSEQQKLIDVTIKQLRLRIKFIPYLLAAYADYHLNGTPPFRALVMDYPDDKRLRDIDFAWLVGDRLLVVPLRADEEGKTVPLPEGVWHDFHTGECFEGEVFVNPPPDQLAIYVKTNSVLPLCCDDWDYIPDQPVFNLELKIFGDGSWPGQLAWMEKAKSRPLRALIHADGSIQGEAAPYYRCDG